MLHTVPLSLLVQLASMFVPLGTGASVTFLGALDELTRHSSAVTFPTTLPESTVPLL